MDRAIVIICDDNFVESATQTIKSIRLYWNYHWDIVILTTNLSENNILTFQSLWCEIRLQKIDNIFNSSDYPDTVLLKYFLFSKFFKKWDKVLYLDADTLVVSDINNLFLSKGFNAVYDCAFSTLWTQIADIHIQEHIRLSVKYPEIEKCDLWEKLFNVGFFVYDTNIINNSTLDELIQLNNVFDGLFKFPEQPILNIYFNGKIHFLPMYYNNYVWVLDKMGYSKFSEPRKQFGILHFCWRFKHYLKESPYYNFYKLTKDQKTIEFDSIDIEQYQKDIIKVNLEIWRINTVYSDFHKCFYIKQAPISYKDKQITNL